MSLSYAWWKKLFLNGCQVFFFIFNLAKACATMQMLVEMHNRCHWIYLNIFLQTWFAYKYHWSEQRKAVMLRAGNHSFDQLDSNSQKVLASYYYKDITAIYEASDYPGGFVLQVKGHSKMTSRKVNPCPLRSDKTATNNWRIHVTPCHYYSIPLS